MAARYEPLAQWAGRFPVAIPAVAALPLVFLLLARLFGPTMDPAEPPAIPSKIPFVGHILSLARESTSYYQRLFKKRALPICTLPMLNGKVYLVNSPEFAGAIIGLSQRCAELAVANNGLDKVAHVMHSSLTAGPVAGMISQALVEVTGSLNSIKPGESLHVPDVFIWLREIMSMATMRGLYGETSPIEFSDFEDFWTFEHGFSFLVLGIAPNIFARKAIEARRRIQAKLTKYYVGKRDQLPTVSPIVKERASLHREFGFTDEELGISEFNLPWAATTNTIPSLVWLFVTIFSRPADVERIRPEIAAITTITPAENGAGRRAVVDVGKFEKQCPVLMAFYREALRMYNDNTGNRRVVKDVTIQDPETGRSYLLKKGVHLQWAAGVSHNNPAIWGEDADVFNPERWLDVSTQDEKRRRGALIPFGGGRNLCPGRLFALTENLSLIGMLALGYDVKGIQVPLSMEPYLGTAMRPPVWKNGISAGATISSRQGWEDVTWDISS